MRVLVVGAGASIEEAQRANAPKEFWPPTIENFAKKLWNTPPNGFFNYWLPDYLIAQGFDPGGDPTSLFIELSSRPESVVNVERLFEYCWARKGKKFEGDWENLIYHGILNPMTFLLASAFYENGLGIKRLQAGMLVSSRLNDGDVALNLNYETLFEIAATQQGHKLTYVPNKPSGAGLLIAKPHGSFNLLADERSFWFAQPDCIGASPSSGDNFRNWRAIVPPRFNKTYAQHPIAKIILEAIENLRPTTVTFWGVGLTDSDVDLIEIYRSWRRTASVVEVINPDESVSRRVAQVFETEVRLFRTIEDWLGQSAVANSDRTST
jgi:hypothetical protein